MSDATATLATRLNYAQCWEDTRMLTRALKPRAGARILSIASAGDNGIALALLGAEVDAVDVSEAQLALCALKLAGGHVSYADFRVLLGLEDGADPLRVYRHVRPHLPEFAQRYWNAHPEMLTAGVLGQGRFESYLSLFGQRILPLIHRRHITQRWFELDGRAEREQFWDRWNNWRWRALFRVFFGQRVMAARGRSKEQFAHVTGSISDLLMARNKRVLIELDPKDNGYLQWILAGRYLSVSSAPAYLQPEGHAALVDVAERMHLIHTDLNSHMATVSDGTYAGFNLSDVPEYLSPSLTEGLLTEVARTGHSGARIAYWNLFVPRWRPESLADRLDRCTEEAEQLFETDRCPFYGAFQVEEVR